jgi:cellulose synthase/poly-beta-1,6-N-acetylglucosamine synthase-like glycosyltransferase
MIPEVLFAVLWGGWSLFGMISLINVLLADRMSTSPNREKYPFSVSVLVPARNEGNNLVRVLPLWKESIETFLRSHPGSFLEFLLLDDQSEDDTGDIAREFFARSGIPARVVEGTGTPPSGWVGKNWACHRLRKEARGEWLLFADADVSPGKHALEKSVESVQNFGADALSALPRQRMESVPELAVIPWIMHFSILALLPLPLVRRTRYPSLSVCNGQWVLVRASVLDAVGGHAALRGSVLEDVELGRRLKRHGFRLAPVLASSDISVRMYRGWGEMQAGFGKNLYPLVGGHPAAAALAVMVFGFFTLGPILGAILIDDFALLGFVGAVLTLQLALFRAPLRSILPMVGLGVPLVVGLVFRSVRNHLGGRVRWKGRVYAPGVTAESRSSV